MALVGNMFYKIGDWFNRKGLNGRPNWFIGTTGPVLIDTNKPGKVYFNNPQVKLVYDRFADMYSNMQIVKENIKTGEIVEDPELMKLLENPNVLQTQNSWLKERCKQLLVYGNQFTYKNVVAPRLKKYPIALWNPSPVFTEPVLTGKVFDQIELKGIVEKYRYNNLTGGIQRDFSTEDILWQKVPGLDDPLNGVSKLKGFEYPVSNNEAAYKYLNIISSKKGAIGMISNESGDDAGAMPLLKDEKDRIYKDHIDTYGIEEHQRHIILTEATLKWTPMGYPTKDLMLLEQIEANTLTIIDSLGLNVNIFANKNSTYENVRMGYVQSYQDAIQPAADQDLQALSKFLNIEEGFRLRASFDHLHMMKEYKLKGMEGIQKMITMLSSAIEIKLLTPAEAIAILKAELKLK